MRESLFLGKITRMEAITQESVLAFTVRVILGILFFFQGYDKLFRLKVPGVIAFFREESAHRPIPHFLLVTSAYVTTFIEFVCGGLLILGLFKVFAMYFLALDLILVCGAFSILKPMWDMKMVFPRVALLFALLYIPAEWDTFALDALL